jgi:hypothetical protein
MSSPGTSSCTLPITHCAAVLCCCWNCCARAHCRPAARSFSSLCVPRNKPRRTHTFNRITSPKHIALPTPIDHHYPLRDTFLDQCNPTTDSLSVRSDPSDPTGQTIAVEIDIDRGSSTSNTSKDQLITTPPYPAHSFIWVPLFFPRIRPR